MTGLLSDVEDEQMLCKMPPDMMTQSNTMGVTMDSRRIEDG